MSFLTLPASLHLSLLSNGLRTATGMPQTEMRQFVDERAAKIDSEPSGSVAADILEASQEVEVMWTEEQELLAVPKKSIIHTNIFLPHVKTLDKFKVYSFQAMHRHGETLSSSKKNSSSTPRIRVTKFDRRGRLVEYLVAPFTDFNTVSRFTRHGDVRVGEPHTSTSVLISRTPRTPCCLPWHDSFGAGLGFRRNRRGPPHPVSLQCGAAPSGCRAAIEPKGELRPVYLPAMLFLGAGERMVGIDGGPVPASTAPRTRCR